MAAPSSLFVNPFSSRRIRPGAMDFWFASDSGIRTLVERFAQVGYRGQIVGPHGSGKSTLLHALHDFLRDIAPVTWLQVRPRRRGQSQLVDRLRPALDFRTFSQPACSNIFVIDGFEQLDWLSRVALQSQCRARRWGLLVTTHRDANLPTIFACQPDFPTFEALVRSLQNGFPIRLSDRQVRAAYEAFQPDLREALFRLYDVYEQQRRVVAPQSVAS